MAAGEEFVRGFAADGDFLPNIFRRRGEQGSGGGGVCSASVPLAVLLFVFRARIRRRDAGATRSRNDFDFRQREAGEAADQNIAKTEALGAHRRAVGESEDVVRRDVERFGVGEMQADEGVAVADFEADDARPAANFIPKLDLPSTWGPLVCVGARS